MSLIPSQIIRKFLGNNLFLNCEYSSLEKVENTPLNIVFIIFNMTYILSKYGEAA